MSLFPCKHPAAWLRSETRGEKVEPIDVDFERVVYTLRCINCSETVEIKFSRTIGGVDAFLARGRKPA